METRRVCGKINRLPEQVKRKMESMLLEGKTYKEIALYLREEGYEISQETLRRYGKPFLTRFESIRVAKEFAGLLLEKSEEGITMNLHEANNALLNQMILEILLDDEVSPEEKLRASNAIAVLQRAQIASEKLKIDARKEAGAVRNAMELLKQEVFSEIGEKYPEIAEAIIAIADGLAQREAAGK